MNALPKKLLPHMKLIIMTPKSPCLALAVVVLTATAVQADITYTYTGNPFTDVSGPYTTSDRVTATVTLASPFGPNMPLTIVTPLAFSFSDGVQTITDLNVVSTSIAFETGQTGVITEWEIQVISGFGVVRTTNTPPLGDVVDVGAMGLAQGFNLGAPGEWVLSPVPDVGSTLALLFLSLTALGVAARRLKWAAA
jgi:hypothetical protein